MTNTKISTKERIINEALILFAKNGYDGVSVREISAKVGVSASALYKHYKSKEEIFYAVLEKAKEKISETYISLKVPEKTMKDPVKGYRELSSEQLFHISLGIFELFVKDFFVSNFRKIVMREQFSKSEVASIYNEIFVKGAVDNMKKLFESFIAEGFFIKEKAEIIAMEFYGPIYYMFSQYDNNPDKKEDIKKSLKAHIKRFGESFTNTK